jgi:hypothetical protein
MTELAEVALAFCRECLGWEDAYIAAGSINAPDDGQSGVRMFFYDTGGAAIQHVHAWCKEHCCHWGVVGNSRHGESEYLAYVIPHDDYWEGRDESAESPCRALLAACVEANRKLKP